jgi:hypothetical protein
MTLENESLFEDIEVYDPSRKFLQWSEQYLSNNKADQCHSKGVSFNNCMLRIPGQLLITHRRLTVLRSVLFFIIFDAMSIATGPTLW